MTNKEESIQNYKDSRIHIPLKTLYGSKYLLSLINLILICAVIILCIVSTLLFILPPAKEISTILKAIESQKDNDVFTGSNSIASMFSGGKKLSNVDYSTISTKNIFSPDRKEWITKVPEPKPKKVVKKKFPKKKTLPRKTKKFILHGIIIAENIKKALINNPMTGLKKKRTLYVEEGDEIEGYRVTSIESDHIKLDWQGEEIIVELYSGLEDINKSETEEALKTNQGVKRHRKGKYPVVPGMGRKPDFGKKRRREDKNPFADIK